MVEGIGQRLAGVEQIQRLAQPLGHQPPAFRLGSACLLGVIEVGILEGHADLLADRGQQRELLGAKGTFLRRSEEESAQHAALRHERYAHRLSQSAADQCLPDDRVGMIRHLPGRRFPYGSDSFRPERHGIFDDAAVQWNASNLAHHLLGQPTMGHYDQHPRPGCRRRGRPQ